MTPNISPIRTTNTGSSLVYMFPGQGSQHKGMGGDLFERYPDITRAADEILGYSIATLCRHDPYDQIDQTQFTQPALFTVNALMQRRLLEQTRRAPDFVVGHSLGEYNALLVSGVFDFATGLRIVKRRSALMAQANGGSMAAIIGLTRDQVRDVILLYGTSEVGIASLNDTRQIVVSGARDTIDDMRTSFEEAGARMYIPLKVSGAFHSRLMEPARVEFEDFLRGFEFAAPSIPVISNVEALPYPPNRVAELLARQITSPVRWVESIQYLQAQPESTFEEVGPGTTLKDLLRRIRPAPVESWAGPRPAAPAVDLHPA